jgi:hypothetical protein
MQDPFQSHQAQGVTTPFVNPYINPIFSGLGISPVGQINPGIYGIHPQTQMSFQQPGFQQPVVPQLQNPVLLAGLQNNPLLMAALQNPLVTQLLQAQHGLGVYPGVQQQVPYGASFGAGQPFAQVGHPYPLAPQTALGPNAWLGQGYGVGNPSQQLAFRAFQTPISPWACF